MADSKVSALTEIAGADVDVDLDFIPIVDSSAPVATRTKKITPEELVAKTSSFTQSGSGASAETVQTLLRYAFRSVKSFGALGDGTTDDTTAIQAAVTALAAGECLYF